MAGFDNDTITGGPGRDAIFADATGSFCGIFSCTVPFGNDTVNARDGEVDSIDCGVGADRAVVDTIDTHANCETVEVAGGGGPAAAAAAAAGGAGSLTRAHEALDPPDRRARPEGSASTCPAACTIVADLRTNRALARKLRLPRSRKLAGARKTLRADGVDDAHAEGRAQGEAALPAPAQGDRDPAGADDRRRQEDDDGHADAEAQAVS